MQRWRREVGAHDGAEAMRNLRGDETSVSFARGVERQGRTRRHGWLLLSKGAVDVARREYTTGLPAGTYCDRWLGGTAGDVCSDGRSIAVDWRGAD